MSTFMETETSQSTLENKYSELLQQAVAVLEQERTTAARQLTTTLNSAYWKIGKLLHDRKVESSHGSGIVNRLSIDLKDRYPQMGLSPRNLWNMKKFYERYHACNPKLQQAVAVLPWSHNMLLMSKFKDNDHAIEYYATEIST